MIDNWQTPLALLVVAVTAVLLLRGVWKRRRAPGSSCGGDCGCPTGDLKFKSKAKK